MTAPLQPPVKQDLRVIVTRRDHADADRRRELVRRLRMLLDKQGTPGEGRRP